MADNVIGIKFGVAGGSSLDGESGKLIKSQLESLASQISLKININKTYFKNQLDSLKKELDKTLGELKINIKSNVKANVKSDTKLSSSVDSSSAESVKQQEARYEALVKALDEVYRARERLLKMPWVEDGKDNVKFTTIAGNLAEKELKDRIGLYEQLREEIRKSKDMDEERFRGLGQYDDLLNSILEKEKLSVAEKRAAAQYASPSAVAKLSLRSQELFSTKGFDKVIARSREAAKLVADFNAKVKNAVGNGDGAVPKEVVANLNTELLTVQKRLTEIGQKTNTVGSKIKEAFDSKIIQRIAQVILLFIGNAIRQVYLNVKEINAAMTELKIITQATSKQMENAAKNIAKSAKQIGASIADLTKSVSVYARLGYTLSEAQTLAKNTTVYANVSGVNVDEATANITGAIKAYNLSIDEIERVLDKFVWVGNKFAISQAEIGEAMNNAASSLKANGNSIDEAMGILAAANASVQDISKSSTAVRTIAARIAASTAELEKLGEDAGDILSTADLAEKMRAFHVEILDANGELRSTYDILNDLSKVWNNEDIIGSVDQAAIANMFSGKRQADVFASIMNNWEDARKVVEGVTSSVGTLQKAQETYLDSIEGKTNQLKAAWGDFSINILNSGLVKGFVDILTWLAKILEAISSVGNSFVSKGAAGAAAAVLVITLLQKLKRTILDYTKVATLSLKTIGLSIRQFMAKAAPILILSLIISAMTSMEGKMKGWTEVIVGFIFTIGATIKLVLHYVDEQIKLFEASNPLGWVLLAITAIISLVKGVFDLIEAFHPSYDTLKETAKDSIDQWKSIEDELDKTVDKLEEVNKKIDEINNKGTLSLVDTEELKYLEEQKANLESIQERKQESAERAKQKAAADAANALGKYNDTGTVSNAPWWEWMLLGPFAFIHQGIAWGSDTYEERFNEILENYTTASEEDKDFIDKTLSEFGDMLDGFEIGDSAELDPYIRQYFNMLDRYHLKAGNVDTTWNRILKDSRFKSEVEALKELANAQDVSIEKILNKAPQFLNYLKEIGIYADNDTQSADALVKSIKELRDRLEIKSKISFTDDLDLMQDKYDSLSNALKDIDENGVISMDNISKIIDKDAEGYPALLGKYFKYINGVGYKLADEWAGKSKTDILTAMARDELQAYSDIIVEAQKTLDGMTSENEDYQIALDNVTTAQENLNIKTTEWATILREQALEEETDRLKQLQDSLEDQADKYKELIDIRKDLLTTYKDEVDYQKELAKKQKNIADLETQLALAKLDKSAAGQAEVRELQEKLNEARDELDDYTLEKAIFDLTAQLDEDYDAYKEFIQTEVDKLIETIDNLAANFKVELSPKEDGSVTGVASHHSGGFVGNMVQLKSNEEFAKLLNGEFVATPEQMDSFMRKILPNIIARGGSGAVINNNSPLIEITCGNIDKESFPKLNILVDQAVEKIEKNMESALNRAGYKKKF